MDHAEAYVDGTVHTNRMENYWSLLKRTIKGTYVSIEPFTCSVMSKRSAINERKLTDGERFRLVLNAIAGKRLTWDVLTAQEAG